MKRQQQQLLRLGLDPNPQVVVYNRVPKCGSTTTLDIIRFLKKKLKFHVYNDIAPRMKHYVETDAEELGNGFIGNFCKKIAKNYAKFRWPKTVCQNSLFLVIYGAHES